MYSVSLRNLFLIITIIINQVVTGGQYDVDVIIESPTKEILYRQVKSQFDSHTFVATVSGPYAICFSNEFSTFSHKLVYMDLQVGEEPALPGIGEHITVMTQVCEISYFFYRDYGFIN